MSLNDHSAGKHNDAVQESNQEQKQFTGIFDVPKKEERTTEYEIRNAFTTALLNSEAMMDKYVDEGKFPHKNDVLNLSVAKGMEKGGPSEEAKDQALQNIIKAVDTGEGLNNIGEEQNKKRQMEQVDQSKEEENNKTDNSNLHDYKPEEKKQGA